MENLIEWLKSDPDGAFGEVYETYRIGCINWMCASYKVMPEEALDIYHSAILVLYQNAKEEKINHITNLKNYAIGICKHLLLSWKKREKKFQDLKQWPLMIDYFFDFLEGDEDKYEVYERCVRAIDSLGSPCSEVINKFYLEEKNLKEITEEMGYKNVLTTKTQKYKCLTRLKHFAK